jgi:HEAT repeat protein
MERSPFVQRVLLTVLDKTDDMPPIAALEVLSTHEDSALRREALRLMMKEEATREVGVQRALRDPDERMVSLALAQALKEPTPSIVSAIMDRVDMGEDLSADVRSRAIRAVAASGSETVVPWLRDLVLTQHWLLRFTKLRKPSPESIGAVAALAAHWAEHRDAALALRLARRSRDVRYRHALRRAEER